MRINHPLADPKVAPGKALAGLALGVLFAGSLASLACGQPTSVPAESGTPKQLPTIAIPFPPLPAAAPPPSADPRNIEGFYVNLSPPKRVILDENGATPPYLPATAALLHKRIAMTDAGHPAATPMSFCRPPGFFTNFALNFPVRILQQPKETLFVFEEMHALWRIPMSASAPRPGAPRYEGFSTGRWDGDTLVITTVGVRRDTWLDIGGTSHSARAVFTHRIRKIEGGRKLQIRTTIDDPNAFARPWTTSTLLTWRPDQSVFAEYNCEESAGSVEEAQQFGTDTSQGGVDAP